MGNKVKIDDIFISTGSCPAEAPCASALEFKCSGKCVDNSKKCDGEVDCGDMSDELSCGYAVNCDLNSDCRGYRITKFLASYGWKRTEGTIVTSLHLFGNK